jgi:hypothetical protein
MNLGHHEEFLSRLDNAVQNVFARDYAPLFEETCFLLKTFNGSTRSTYSPASIEEFQARVMRGEYAEGIPAPGIVARRVFVAKDYCRTHRHGRNAKGNRMGHRDMEQKSGVGKKRFHQENQA